MTVTASIEHTTSIVRCGPDHRTPYDPYSWCCTIRWLDPITVEVLAALRAPTHEERRAMTKALMQLGARKWVRERVRPDGQVDRRKRTAKE
jgi:hypothetical protein